MVTPLTKVRESTYQLNPVTRDLLYKVLIVGDVATGKTSFISRFNNGTFSPNYKSTIGVDFHLKVINWDAKTVVRLQLWDIAGQERFGSMTRIYYKEAVGAMVFFDVTRINTFETTKKWKIDIDAKVKLPGTENPIPVVLVANKVDMAKFGIDREQMNTYCCENGFCGWFETSAKSGLNVTDSVHFLVQNILNNFISEEKEEQEAFHLSNDVQRVPVRNACSC
eukprot:TRINITY_DN12007_c0_g1_i1.p1 TRINITY_DN12007_c0_g1~~TRINITY_DN12007_c0_g1_i1.p1  ORF type:complete len:223 (-),score=22.43 TRINITY_DN12007_c0_g1_i1:63-731(-)